MSPADHDRCTPRHPMREWVLRGAALLAMLFTAAIVAWFALDRFRPVPEQVQPSQCTGVDRTRAAITQGEVKHPVCDDGFWVAVLPATTHPENPRRSELHLGASGRPLVGTPDDTVVHDVQVRGRLRSAARSPDDWHVIWQLHGQTDGAWRPPPVVLVVRKGFISLSGGSGHAGQSWETANYEWARDLAPFEDDRTYHIRVVVKLSSAPDQGWVSAQVDGRTVADRWIPESLHGLRPGTMYPGQPRVSSRIGLYRGTNKGVPPTYEQQFGTQVIEASINGERPTGKEQVGGWRASAVSARPAARQYLATTP